MFHDRNNVFAVMRVPVAEVRSLAFTYLAYCLSSVQVCSPHSHLNMRTVRPFTVLSIVRIMSGFLPQMPQALTGLGSYLEKTSFLNSSLIRKPRVGGSSDKLQSEHLFRIE